MTYFQIDGLGYYVVEEGTGEPLVLFHGFTGSHENWRPFLSVFGQHYRTIAIDLPGHGLTDAPEEISRYSFTRVAEDMVHLLAQLGVSNAHWLGYSMGGRLALFIAVHNLQLVRTLVIESGSPGLDDFVERENRRQLDEALAARIETEGIPAFVRHWEHLPLFASQLRLPQDVLHTLRAQRLNNSSQGLANSLRGMGTGTQTPLWDELREVHKPVLLIAGEMDEKFVAINRHMASQLPAAEFIVVPDAGHTVHLERPDKFAGIVLEFLQRNSSGKDLTDAKQDHKYERGQRHLLQPRVEGW